MTDKPDNIYDAWDVYAAAACRTETPPSIVVFASDWLQRESQTTHHSLNWEQASLLIRLIDSFVDDTGRRHRESVNEGGADAEAMGAKAIANEFNRPLFTAVEIEHEIKSCADQFADMTEEEIRDKLQDRKRLFKRLKALMFSKQGDCFETVIAPFLPEAEREEAKRLFVTPNAADSEIALASDLEQNVQAHVDFIATQATLARGLRSRSFVGMLTDEDGLPTESVAPRCLQNAFGGKLFSQDEDIVRKLTAVEFLLARMDLENDQEVALPFLAVGAARAAYDWVTERKTAYQLAMLTTLLDDLDPQEVGAVASKELRQ